MIRSGDVSDASVDKTEDEPVWNCDEIERLYKQALDAVEAVANDLDSVSQTLSAADESDADVESLSPSGEETTAGSHPELESPAPENAPSAAVVESRPDPAQVIEALLFVGGQALTAKAICSLLRGEIDASFVEQATEEIGRRYARQNRPYEIRLGDGGYRIVLRPEYEPLRNRVYGFGPKQVRLSQETLEILALVAYRQPITRRMTEDIAKRHAGAALRQLVERGLLILDPPQAPAGEESQYRTTPRFLQLFGVSRLEDLPQIEDLNYK
jgi:segregation and condensation protein B